MDTKQMHLNDKSMVDRNSIKRLVNLVENLEQKLSSVKIIHEKFFEFLSIVSNTHQAINDELTAIKNILNQTNIEQLQDDDEIISIDETKSDWDDDDEDIPVKKPNRRISPSIRSASSYDSSSTIENRPNSSTSKRSSNLKKSDQSSSRAKSVTFTLDDKIQNQQLSADTKNKTTDEITKTNLPSLSSDTSQHEITPKIGNMSTNIRIHEIESQNGDYIRLLNISNSDDYHLGGHFLQQNIHSKPICRYRFSFNTIIRAGHTVTVWCGNSKDINPQPPHVFLWKEQRKWETGPECLTILAKPDGQAIAWFRNSHRLYTDQSSSDILFVHSKSNMGTSDKSNISSNSIKNPSRHSTRQSRLSAFDLIGNNKPPFAYSPNNPIHPDHNGTTGNLPNDLRSQMHQRGRISQLFNRPKSTPFANHMGCKQDLISRNSLRKQQTQGHKQTTVKT